MVPGAGLELVFQKGTRQGCSEESGKSDMLLTLALHLHKTCIKVLAQRAAWMLSPCLRAARAASTSPNCSVIITPGTCPGRPLLAPPKAVKKPKNPSLFRDNNLEWHGPPHQG